MMDSAVTDFPLPLSPTSAKISPSSISKSIPLTTGTGSPVPERPENPMRRSETLRTLISTHLTSWMVVNFGLPSRFGW